jgi:hypothetical protein
MTDRPEHCAHCWHGTGMAYATYPPQYPEYCCQCGVNRVRKTQLYNDSPSHGPYYRPLNIVHIVRTEGL